jgi:putative glutamine amidotransferase
MKPIIGVTPTYTKDQKYHLSATYLRNLTEFGVSTVILPYEVDSIPTYLKTISGLLLSGGGDIAAQYFNEPHHEKANPPTIERDEFELQLCREALKMNLPILGICRGEQLLNVALGGNIIQHLDGHNHGDDDRVKYIHTVKLTKGSKLHSILGSEEIQVNSVHHQAVGSKLGDGVSVSAVSPEGFAEAIEVTSKKFVVGVQWHPEELKDANTTAIFRAFTDACKG